MTPAIAIFPWGEVIEDYLEPLGLGLDDFARRMSGGWLFGYVAALQQAGWRPVIVGASGAVAQVTRLEHAPTGTPLWFAPGRRTGGGALRPYPSLRYVRQWQLNPGDDFTAILDRERCGAILVQEYEYIRFDLLSRLARRTGRPIYATFQGGDVTLSALERLVRPWALRRCTGLVVASARERVRLRDAYPGLMMRVADIPNPLDTAEWRPEDRAEARAALGLPPDAFLMVNHGRIDIRRKGLDILVEAWSRFARRRPEARALIVGSGQDHAAFARLLASRAPERLTWVDRYVTDRVEMRRLLSAADVFVTASRTEGMPVAPLEAMACGLPVICSDAQGLPDIFAAGEQHGGIVTPREDVGAVVAALDRLAADPLLRRRLGRAARARVEARFSIPAVGAALARFMRPLAPVVGICRMDLA